MVRLVVVALGVWFALLNLLTASADLPAALHGRRVDVTVRSCHTDRAGLRTCIGEYRLGPVLISGRNVLGGDTLREGATVRATVDRNVAADPSIADPRSGVGEAALFALAGLVTAGVALVGLRRRCRRRLVPEHPAGVVPEDAGEDPLAWARRRRFGAGRT
ncbi:MAG: hypothetical protein NVS3B21_13980 [Acidimicrobiales bacterium]